MEDKQDYIKGIWTDSNGTENPVRFKKSWGKHVFSDTECNSLLKGDIIAFEYTNGTVRGHLQYLCTAEGIRYFGFCPDYSHDYCKNPVYTPDIHSRFEGDMDNEALMNRFMRLYYYANLLNSDGSRAQSEFVVDKERQKQGVDVIVIRNKKTYIIDEKSQLDYIYREDGPINSFTLELLNSTSGNIGWFINENLETEYYMFIWPHADKRPLKDPNDIEYAHYALVNRARLKDFIEVHYSTPNRLLEYAQKLSNGTLEGAYEEYNKRYYKCAPFDNSVYLVLTEKPREGKSGKTERPVNLLVKRFLLEKIAEEKGFLKRSNDDNGGIR